MQKPNEFIQTIIEQVEKHFKRKRLLVEVKYATIDPDYSSGRPRVQYEGESVLALKPHPYLASYSPTAGDKVQIINGVIQGKVM